MEAHRQARPIAGASYTNNSQTREPFRSERYAAGDLLQDEDLRTEREPVKEPPKRWRNWWRATAFIRDTAGHQFPEGHVVTQRGVWPSKELAEQAAHEYMISNAMRFGANKSEYLGAYPEGERP